jgi:hypothetical protein
VFDPAQKVLQQLDIEDRLRHRIFSARGHFIFESPDFFVQVGESGIRPYADHKSCARSNRISAQIQPSIQVVNNIHQSNGIHIKYRRCVRIVTHLRRIARDADQVLDSYGSRAKQITLNTQHIPVAASVVQDGIDSCFLLHQQRQCLIAHARRSPRTIRDVHRIHAHRFQKSRTFQLLRDVSSLRRNYLHHGDELAPGKLCPQRRSFL